MPAKEHPCGQLSQTAGRAGQERAEQGRAGSSLLCKNFKLLCKFHLPPRPLPRLQTVQQCRSKGALLGAWQSTNNRQHHVGSLARTKAPGKRHNSSGRSDFMPDFNYQYAPSTWSTCPPLPHLSTIPPPFIPSSISNNGHKSFHMPSVWSAQSMVHSGQGISTGNAIFYFRADFDSVSSPPSFFWGMPASQSCHRASFRLFCQLSATMNLII